MSIDADTVALLANLARRPGHDETKAYFAELLVREFGIEREALNFEVRAPVIRGRLDALIGRTVFEAKRNVDKEMDDVLRRMPDYLADRQREHGGEPFVGVASDGRKWIVFELVDGALVRVKDTELDPDKPEAFLAWLDGVLALKGSLPPDPMTVRAELGQDSVAFRHVERALRGLWTKLKDHPAEVLKRQLWAELLKLVHGKDVDADALWFQHSYLVVVAKCIALAVMDLPEDDPRRMLSGEAFTAAGIGGAVESDFFDWMVAAPEGEALIRRIMAHVRRFRLREVESDVLKVLYESLIDRDERHGLGEYYTPDWLATKVVRHAVTAPLEQNVLDPACGSGTFLFHAVRRVLAEAEDAGIDIAERAGEATRRVTGMDIHPVAVILARVTFLLALAPALARRRGSLNIPVYLGDAMQLGIAHTLNETRLEIRVPPPPAGAAPLGKIAGREVLSFPETFCRDPGLFDLMIEHMRTASLADRTRDQVEAALTRITDKHLRERPMTQIERASGKAPEGMTDEHVRAIVDLGATYALLDRLRREGRDTIWTYVARNLSRPLSLSTGGGWANVIVGNPPWVAYRHMSADLQTRFKELAVGERVYVGGKFATQNDLCGLFTTRASHLYLRPAGKIGFVLPLAVMTRGQFSKFRSGSFASYAIAWDEAWTMDDSVTPLFPVPACAVFGRKRATGKAMPDTVRAYSGWLPMRDAHEDVEDVADARLRVEEGAKAPQVGEFSGGSPYRARFRQGAILAPRMLCFVERRPMGRLGANASAPAIKSRRSLQEKEPWRSLRAIEGQVEERFLRPAYVSEHVLPWRLVGSVEAALPFDDVYGALTLERSIALNESRDSFGQFTHLVDWLQQTEKTWNDHKADATTISLAEQFDYYGKLAAQFPVHHNRVVYTTSGSLPCAAIIKERRAVIDTSLYWSQVEGATEATFLVGLLNSDTLRQRVERFQARGQFGARHFHKVMFNLPIPLFDAKVKLHRDLAALGAHAEVVAKGVDLPDGIRFVAARQRIRRALIQDGIGGEIEKAVEKLLGPA